MNKLWHRPTCATVFGGDFCHSLFLPNPLANSSPTQKHHIQTEFKNKHFLKQKPMYFRIGLQHCFSREKKTTIFSNIYNFCFDFKREADGCVWFCIWLLKLNKLNDNKARKANTTISFDSFDEILLNFFNITLFLFHFIFLHIDWTLKNIRKMCICTVPVTTTTTTTITTTTINFGL